MYIKAFVKDIQKFVILMNRYVYTILGKMVQWFLGSTCKEIFHWLEITKIHMYQHVIVTIQRVPARNRELDIKKRGMIKSHTPASIKSSGTSTTKR